MLAFNYAAFFRFLCLASEVTIMGVADRHSKADGRNRHTSDRQIENNVKEDATCVALTLPRSCYVLRLPDSAYGLHVAHRYCRAMRSVTPMMNSREKNYMMNSREKLFEVFWRESSISFTCFCRRRRRPRSPAKMALLFRRAFATTAPNLAVNNVTVYGSGLMGSGIVQVRTETGRQGKFRAGYRADVGVQDVLPAVHIPQIAAAAGYKVTMVDVNDDVLKKARSRIEKSLQVRRRSPTGVFSYARSIHALARRRALNVAPPSVWPTRSLRTSRPTQKST